MALGLHLTNVMSTAAVDVRCLYPLIENLKAASLVSDAIIVLANVRVCVGADLGSPSTLGHFCLCPG